MKIDNYDTLVRLQHELNIRTISPTYLNKDINWNGAIIRESGELLDSIGFKWWKKQSIDMENAKIEAVDLLHFVISDSLKEKSLKSSHFIKKVIDEFALFFEEKATFTDFKYDNDIENIINELNYKKYSRFFVLKKLFSALEMSNEDVYVAYIVKNCLNQFRQDNGYVTGTYIKDWGGREDNVFAYAFSKEVKKDKDMYSSLYGTLQEYYDMNVKNSQETA